MTNILNRCHQRSETLDVSNMKHSDQSIHIRLLFRHLRDRILVDMSSVHQLQYTSIALATWSQSHPISLPSRFLSSCEHLPSHEGASQPFLHTQ
jgi:hypothetical protein